jgi:hypothetical protein
LGLDAEFINEFNGPASYYSNGEIDMLHDDSAMKDIARMNFEERLLVLRRDAKSPEQIKTADRIIEAMLQELQIVRAVRNDAALRYGVKLPPLADLPAAADTQPPPKKEYTGFDGTLAGLLDRYLSDPESPFVKLRFHTRKYYTICCKRLQKEYGTVAVDQIGMTTFEDWHRRWTTENGSSMAKALITILRLVFSFGATRLQDSHCIRISLTLSKMKFKTTKSRSVKLNRDQAVLICAEAHRQRFPSIALAQALLFETSLTQIEIIGEWVPLSEKGGDPDVTYGDQKWRRGLRWEEIDADWVVRHPTITAEGEIVEDLKNYPIVKAELDRITRRSSGPVIINEHAGIPWTQNAFAKQWRKIATAVGVPRDVRNADTRARTHAPTKSAQKGKRATEDLPSTARH